MIEYDDVRLVNCAGCNRELLGDTMRDFDMDELPEQCASMDWIFIRIKGRPYCLGCRSTSLTDMNRSTGGGCRVMRTSRLSIEDICLPD